MQKNYFHYAFQLSKSIIFEVSYYRLGSNKSAHFSTSAAHFNRPKTDFNHCGQAQNVLTQGFTKARSFWKKWDFTHLMDLNDEQYSEMVKELEVLENQYNFIRQDREINFSDLVTFSKQTPKRLVKKTA